MGMLDVSKYWAVLQDKKKRDEAMCTCKILEASVCFTPVTGRGIHFSAGQ
jgi:hypothetical protein